jgi:hypothetical protein
MPEKTIRSLFLDVCEGARWDGILLFGVLSSKRTDPSHPTMRPGYYYNNLPEDIKERLRNELKSEHAQDILLSVKLYGHVESWWNLNTSEFYKKECLKFEQKLIRHGWKPNFSFSIK